METELAMLVSDYGLIGFLLLGIITGQIVPKFYYNKLLEDNKLLQENLVKSMDTIQTQAEMLASYKKSSGGENND